jgi:hypothetical protein
MKCQKCKKEIKELIYNSKVEVSQTFELDENNKVNYGSMEDYGDHYDDEYSCPNCDTVLFRDEDTATKFLLEEKIKKDKTKK